VRKRSIEMGAVVTPLGSGAFGRSIHTEMRKCSDGIVQSKITFQQ